MTNAIDARAKQVNELRELARQFRAKASETELLTYVDLMRRSADELERLADRIEAELASGTRQAAVA